MALTDNKINTFTKPVSTMPDSPTQSGLTATQIKAWFDSNTVTECKTSINGIVDGLIARTGASEIGAQDITDVDITVQGHIDNVSNPHGVTNTQVGLGNVTNNLQATKTDFDAHVNNVSNPHSVTKAQVGLGNCDNTSDANKPISTAQAAALALKVDKATGKSLVADTEITRLLGIATGAEVNVQSDWTESNSISDAFIKNKPTLGTAAAANTGSSSGNVPILDASGKLSLTVIPASAITETDVVASEVEMLALTAEPGDVAVRTDENKSYILKATPASTLTNWQTLLTPTDTVLSVNSKTGAVTLTADDVGALDTSDIENVLTSTSTTTALSANQGRALSVVQGLLSNLDAYFTSTARDSLVNAINEVITRVGTGSFDAYFTGITDLVSIVNYISSHKVECSSMLYLRINDGNIEVSTDNTTWVSAKGEQGIQGKGYNPRGAWASGGSYVNNTTTIDVVLDNGSSYYCKNSVSGTTAPSSDPTNWDILAYSGATAIASDILMTGYTIAGAYSAVAPTDTVSTAIGKIEKGVVGKVNTVTGVSGNMVQFGAGNIIADSGIAFSVIGGILRVTY